MVDQAEPTYITHHQAAEILGVGRGTVGDFVKAGLITSRGLRGRGMPALNARDVHALAAERAGLAASGRHPPPGDHDWLGLVAVAELLGVTVSAVSQRCRRGSIPFEVHDRQRWFRRDLIETWAHARSAQQARRA